MATLAPASAYSRAISFPSPPAPPKMIAFFPVRSKKFMMKNLLSQSPLIREEKILISATHKCRLIAESVYYAEISNASLKQEKRPENPAALIVIWLKKLYPFR